MLIAGTCRWPLLGKAVWSDSSSSYSYRLEGEHFGNIQNTRVIFRQIYLLSKLQAISIIIKTADEFKRQ